MLFFDEVLRVLKPQGYVILELMQGTTEGYKPKEFEVSVWETMDDIINIIQDKGFVLICQTPFTIPWSGCHCVFRRVPAKVISTRT